MAHDKKNTDDQKLIGLMAQFDDPDTMLAAAAKLRKAGYTKTDAYMPFPVHGVDDALGIKPTILPWIVLALGLFGGVGGLALQYWTNAVDYPFIISGKPLFSLPANIPVVFELTILHAAFAVFLGMLALNRLPTFSNPLFRVPEFARATDDKFFLTVDANDGKYKPNKTRELFDSFGGSAVIEVFEDPSEGRIPPTIKYVAIGLATLAVFPPIFLWQAAYMTSQSPRIHPIWDMDTQLRGDTQTTSPIFADNRIMRPQIAGTVARGEWMDPIFLTGIVPENTEQNVVFLQAEEAEEQPAEENQPAAKDQPEPPAEPATETDENAAEEPAEAPAAGAEPPTQEGQPASGQPAENEPNWVKVVPLDVSLSVLERGRQRYNIYCAVCHGLAGDGDGVVAQRANQLGQSTWVPPTNLHTDYLLTQPDGKIYNTIAHGIRKMPGYAKQIPPDDRWAIVTYVRALQKSRTAKPDEVPTGQMQQLEIQGR